MVQYMNRNRNTSILRMSAKRLKSETSGLICGCLWLPLRVSGLLMLCLLFLKCLDPVIKVHEVWNKSTCSKWHYFWLVFRLPFSATWAKMAQSLPGGGVQLQNLHLEWNHHSQPDNLSRHLTDIYSRHQLHLLQTTHSRHLLQTPTPDNNVRQPSLDNPL